jgi:hypothetical protein
MRTLAARRVRNLACFIVVSGALLFLFAVLNVSLHPTQFYTGWLVTIFMLVLTGYNWFKKVPFLPLGRSATWLQVHIYVGLLTCVVFLLHAGLQFPGAALGWILWLLFALIAGSGLVGLLISRTFPVFLRALGEEVIYEQIPVYRRRLQEQAEQLVVDAVAQLHSTHIATFYTQHLKWFFDRPRHFWRHVAHSSAHRQSVLTEIKAQDRYLNDKERDVMNALRDLVKRKDDLDCHHALQGMLKYWLFVHVPCTYSLWVFAVFHIVVVYAYAGVTR